MKMNIVLFRMVTAFEFSPLMLILVW